MEFIRTTSADIEASVHRAVLAERLRVAERALVDSLKSIDPWEDGHPGTDKDLVAAIERVIESLSKPKALLSQLADPFKINKFGDLTKRRQP